jgi:hypothetical protein
MRIPDPDAEFLVKFHFGMMATWALLIVPTVIWWKDSILWVALMSIWANFYTAVTAWDAARAERASNNDG